MDSRFPTATPKHTPGPWTARPAEDTARDSGHGFEITSAHDECFKWHVAGTWSELPEGQEAANARLIAMAPELLIALEHAAAELYVCADEIDDKDMKAVFEGWGAAARAVVLKARGELQ